jgi:phosphatidylserine/phosphatidylglycerophosphate/cardiolipin synthase-like enzyme
MVWTGPDTGLVASRSTEQIMLELISLAKERLFLVSFVSYNVDKLVHALLQVSRRDVQINILLEPSIEHGGKLNFDSAKEFIKNIPLVNIYVWDKEKVMNKGVVHAKCAVADGKIAFITSANLTMAAMEYNMELGIIIRGGDLPDTLERHLNALIETGVIKALK